MDSYQARQALFRLGYTSKDVLYDSNYTIPEAFSTCRKEQKEVYLKEVEKARKQRLEIYLE